MSEAPEVPPKQKLGDEQLPVPHVSSEPTESRRYAVEPMTWTAIGSMLDVVQVVQPPPAASQEPTVPSLNCALPVTPHTLPVDASIPIPVTVPGALHTSFRTTPV